MDETLSIAALAKRTGVSSKTLRYWESLGLMPRAARSHTGYRLFGPECVGRVEFIRKAQSLGLTLREVGEIFELSRRGRNPCPKVLRWVEGKTKALEEQIQWLTELRQRLDGYRRQWRRKSPCPRLPVEICCLIEDLPTVHLSQGGARHAKTLVTSSRRLAGHRR
ncbi:MAG: MerR family DNA-binding protein [Acidobacteria bacterium]|nr:MerR family DNA-binding protein [Acidobacteriota bacterium]MBI1982741.1 MerR family DNA-binding protein [Acidobacteriota bacterium]